MRDVNAEGADLLDVGELVTAKTIAERFGKSLRAVQGWFGQGLPFREVERRGQPARVTTEQAVRQWAKASGVRLGTPRDAPLPIVAEAEAAAVKAAADFETRVQQEVERRLLNLVDDPDYDGRIVDFRKVIAQIFRVSETGVFEAAEAAQASQALKNASAELRQLEREAMERRVRRGELIERSAMVRAVGALCDVVASHRDAAPGIVAREVAAAVQQAVPEGSEIAARAAQAAAERAVAKVFAAVAEAVEAGVGGGGGRVVVGERKDEGG